MPDILTKPTKSYEEIMSARTGSHRHAGFIQVEPGGICFAHGPYNEENCPKWPLCITDPQHDKYVRMGLEHVNQGSARDSEIANAARAVVEAAVKRRQAVKVHVEKPATRGSEETSAFILADAKFDAAVDALIALRKEEKS